MHRFLHSKGQDYPFMNSPEIDKLLDDGRYTWDPGKRKEMYDKVQRAMLSGFNGIWMFHIDFYDATRKNVQYMASREHPPTWSKIRSARSRPASHRFKDHSGAICSLPDEKI